MVVICPKSGGLLWGEVPLLVFSSPLPVADVGSAFGCDAVGGVSSTIVKSSGT